MTLDRWLELTAVLLGLAVPMMLVTGRLQAQVRDLIKGLDELTKALRDDIKFQQDWRHNSYTPMITGIQRDIFDVQERVTVLETRRRLDAE